MFLPILKGDNFIAFNSNLFTIWIERDLQKKKRQLIRIVVY